MNNVLRSTHQRSDLLSLSLLVICNDAFTTNFCNSLRDCHKKAGATYKLVLVKCQHIDEILPICNELCIDYVIFVLDTRVKSSIQLVEKNLRKLERKLVCGRTCIVNGTSYISETEMNVSVNSLNIFKNEYKFPLLHGHISDPDASNHLASRVLHLVSTTLGLDQKSFLIPWLLRP